MPSCYKVLRFKRQNEITDIPELLDSLNVKGNIITIDAMGTQKDYVLALKKNHGNLYDDVKTYFDIAFPLSIVVIAAMHKPPQ